MPPVDVGFHVVGYLYECGPTVPNGAGIAALPHSEIAAWQSNIGIRLRPWEARFIRELSREYVDEFYLASDPQRPAPWRASGDHPEARRRVAESLRSTIRAMTKD
jgi:hypothetical protein